MTNILYILYAWIPLFIIVSVYKWLPPKKINWIYGYRTILARKNITVWNFANKTMANYLLLFTIISLVVNCIIVVLFNKYSLKISFSLFSFTVILSVVLSEIKLSKNFDDDGSFKYKNWTLPIGEVSREGKSEWHLRPVVKKI